MKTYSIPYWKRKSNGRTTIKIYIKVKYMDIEEELSTEVIDEEEFELPEIIEEEQKLVCAMVNENEDKRIILEE